jgi:lysyl-tRNA synthetase class 2
MDQDRLQKFEKIKKTGINPYPDRFNQTHSLREAKESREGTPVKAAGRIMTLREMGKLTFAHLQDFSGKTQIVFEVKEIGKEAFDFLRYLDLGDIIGVEGTVFTTHKGEISILVQKYQLLSKALRPLPEKWHGLKDKETAYRQRYLDLISNRETLERFAFRSDFIRTLREFYWKNGFLEIETPVLASTASGALAKPFVTHHNALDHDFFLRIALETPQKEALVGGFERTFEIGKVFRNEGMDPSHLQEFTMCEHYAAYWNYEDNMNFTEKMFHELLSSTLNTLSVQIPDRDGNLQNVDFGTPWRRVSFRELLQEDSGIDIDEHPTAEELLKVIKKKKIEIEGAEKLGRGNLIDSLYKKVSRPKLVQPTFLTHHPVDLSPLARRNDQNPKVVDRFQLVVNGWEIVNAYSELVDPIDQAKRFEDQSKAKEAGDEEAHGKDDEFVVAMEHGMPPQSGWGMGVDRIVALLTQQNNLKDTVLFPLLKPQQKAHNSLLVVGQIVSHQKHEKKNHINICQVDLGSLGMKTIICAAENVRDGLKVVVALPGFEILDFTGTGKVAYTVEERKTYGVLSEAVMCAPEEVGISESDIENQKLIIELNESFEVGSPYKPASKNL